MLGGTRVDNIYDILGMMHEDQKDILQRNPTFPIYYYTWRATVMYR